MQAFQHDFERFEKLNAQVLGVSSDTLETHSEFAGKHNLTFPLIADDGTIRSRYGGGRMTYLIDRSGIVRYLHKGMPDNEQLILEVGKLAAE
jgi:peroxiredoxin Q/BCP